MREKGISLTETLISLSLFSLVVLASLEFFIHTRNLHQKLKSQQEATAAAISAMVRMKADLLAAGAGLLEPIHLGLLEGISNDENTLTILNKEKEWVSTDDLIQGQTMINLEDAPELKGGREACIFDPLKGEMKSVFSADKKSIALSSPLSFSFRKEKTRIILIQKVSFFYDGGKNIIRRRVNSSPAQPLVEDAAAFEFEYEAETNLARFRFTLNPNKRKGYELTVYPKNIALAKSS
jgi:hypothetical protein